ncbi:MAG TPA: DUF3617 domain-containing protein [Allosphingosinicella sp.]
MRAIALMPLIVLAACSGAEADQKADTSNLKMEAGQWEAASEVISVDSLDKTPPAIKTAVGDKATEIDCLATADVAKPQPALFVGADAGECTYESFYMSRGRLNATLGCERKDVEGDIQVSLEGSYTATSYDVTARTQTYLPGPGDVAIGRKVAGKKVAAQCAAPDPKAAPKA